MKRRGFLGFLGGAVAAGPSVAMKAIDPVLAEAGFASSTLSAAPALPSAPSAGVIGSVVRWIRRNGIPAWKMSEIKRRSNYERQYGIDPDLACLRSVSSGWKARKQRQRNIDRLIEESISSIGHSTERVGFSGKIQSLFGQNVDWYE
ncbi:hypothetical protein [Rhizobium rhizogenes]|uniref:hypothetical protein n=1 Tax=Rhizobium rhizogenes TaxID=359 RepID=UPI0015723725|nr:hypothetical protein [Rhizobium rhizogenes]NTG94240.1 hypothetical protein [Rhizobium rhizogenes]